MRYDAGLSFNECFNRLESLLISFCQKIRQLSGVQTHVFQLPDRLKGEENEEIKTIRVIPVSGESATDTALVHYQRLFIYDNDPDISSKSAIRLPGVMFLPLSRSGQREMRQQLDDINMMKEQLMKIVTETSGVDKTQRFEFVHNQIKGLITLNAYRQIQSVTSPSSVRFGWANKHIIQKVDRDTLLSQLDEQYQNPRAIQSLTREERQAYLAKEISALKQVPEDAILKIKRPVKVQPIARVWYSEAQKQVQYACASPLIVFCDENEEKPVTGVLPDYDAENIKIRHRPKAKKLIPVISRLHLYMEVI
ncbi:TPA: DNA replication terminus site-binding protein [Morganella morganii subsp. morganii]|uniref:DNA replication terminus site-binding protein n=1 Tax=Morganella morganii TaxID=582 RepID=UPI001C7CB4BC|nr:DNA replication terminus site-binding protein [Morganella morganii]HEO9717963.1 DNA replication terminus site-binding protein [Morganella morganii subsp. morganii]